MHLKQGSCPQQTTVPWHKGTNGNIAMERVTCSANYGMGRVTRTTSHNQNSYTPGLVYQPTEATRHHITAGGQCPVGDQYTSEGRYPPVSHHGYHQESTKEQYTGGWQCRRQAYPHRNQYPVFFGMLNAPTPPTLHNRNKSKVHFDCKQQQCLNSLRENLAASHLSKRVAQEFENLETPRSKRIRQDSDAKLPSAQLNGFQKGLHTQNICHRVTSDSKIQLMSPVSADNSSKDSSQSLTQQTIRPMLSNLLTENPRPSDPNDMFNQKEAKKIIVAVVRLACRYVLELRPLFVKQKAKYGVFCVYAQVSLYLLNQAVSEEDKRLMEFYVKYRVMLCKVANAKKCQMCFPLLPKSAKSPTRQEASPSAASSMRKSPVTQTVCQTQCPVQPARNKGHFVSSVTQPQACTMGRSPSAPQPNTETVHPPLPVQSFRQKAASLMKLPETLKNKQHMSDHSLPLGDIVNCFSLKPPAQKIVTPQVTLPKVKQSKVPPGMTLPISAKTECIVIDDSDDEETHEAKENHVSGETFVPSVCHKNHCDPSPVEESSRTLPSTLPSTPKRNSSSKESNAAGQRSHSSEPGSSCYGGGNSAVVVLKNGLQNRVSQAKEGAMNVPLGEALVQFDEDTSLNFLLSREDATFATFVIDEDGEMTMTEFGEKCCEELMRGRRPQS